MHQAMYDGDPSYYAIPDDPKVVGEYLFLYATAAGPDGLNAFIDAGNRTAVIRALSKTDSAAFSRALLQRLQQFAAQRFAGLPVRVGIAGGTLGVQTAMNDLVVHEKIVNMAQVGAIIFVLCARGVAIAGRRGAGGVAAGARRVIILGAMGWTGSWLDMSTAAITAMGVSIGADFAIYLLFRVREELRTGWRSTGRLRTGCGRRARRLCTCRAAVVAGYLTLALLGLQRLGAAWRS